MSAGVALDHGPVVHCDNPADLTRDGSCPDCTPWCPTCHTEWPCPTAEQVDDRMPDDVADRITEAIRQETRS